MALTFAPDPPNLLVGADTAAAQTARPRKYASADGIGWSDSPASGPSTGATAGNPGTWTPANSLPPANFTKMDTITASPATGWTVGQHVVLADATNAYWQGTAWASGKAPAAGV